MSFFTPFFLGYISSIPKISSEAVAFSKKAMTKIVKINKKDQTRLDKNILGNF